MQVRGHAVSVALVDEHIMRVSVRDGAQGPVAISVAIVGSLARKADEC